MQQTYPLPVEELEARIGHRFRQRELVRTALCHSSYSNEMRTKSAAAQNVECNERMEFLGDSVLSLLTSEYIFEKYRELPEGELTKLRAASVCEGALYEYAKSFDLGAFLLLGHGEELNNGRDHKAILADAFEAVLAAIYLDGGYREAKAFLLPFVTKKVEDILKSGRREDYKSMLQQFVQKSRGDILEYRETGEEGPAHERLFFFEVCLNNTVIGRGSGTTKREAEQMAAREALVLFGELGETK